LSDFSAFFATLHGIITLPGGQTLLSVLLRIRDDTPRG
jgi:hypothetical protein